MVDTKSDSEDVFHDVFLSSAWYGLDSVRSALADWLERCGYDAFVFERFKEQAEWAALVPASREAICLDHVIRSRLYIGIFHTSYGSSADLHNADIAFTDLELFEAFRAGLPVRLYLLEGAMLPPKLSALLALVETVFPGVLLHVKNEADLRDRVERDIDVFFGRRTPFIASPSRFSRYARALIAHRKADDDREEGLRFLLDCYPASTLPFDPDLIREELGKISSIQSYEARMNVTWRVFQRLFSVSWQRTHDHLDLWDEALGCWETAAAWRGLHGFIYSGRLAADNTLIAVRVLRASAGERASLAELVRKGETRTGTREQWISLYSTGGALASEYYSIAKQAPRMLKSHYLAKADSWIDVAERTFARTRSPNHEAGLASIRGHIFLEWSRYAEAIPLLERSLHLREEASLGASSVGEAMVDLGFAYFIGGRRRQGEHLIAEGIGELERNSTPGFLARAKRKAAYCYMRHWAFGKAIHELVEAKDLADAYDLDDQGRGVRWMSHLPGFVLDWFRTRSFRLRGTNSSDEASDKE